MGEPDQLTIKKAFSEKEQSRSIGWRWIAEMLVFFFDILSRCLESRREGHFSVHGKTFVPYPFSSSPDCLPRDPRVSYELQRGRAGALARHIASLGPYFPFCERPLPAFFNGPCIS
jgi:hypothetical protein